MPRTISRQVSVARLAQILGSVIETQVLHRRPNSRTGLIEAELG